MTDLKFICEREHISDETEFNASRIWWSRRELNPRPKALLQDLLRAQTVLRIPQPGREPSHNRGR